MKMKEEIIVIGQSGMYSDKYQLIIFSESGSGTPRYFNTFEEAVKEKEKLEKLLTPPYQPIF